MKILRWSEPARRDLERIRNFVDEDIFPDIVIEIVVSARFVVEHPKAAPFVGQSFLRKWPVKRYPYLLFFELIKDEVWIVRVRHLHEDWKSELG